MKNALILSTALLVGLIFSSLAYAESCPQGKCYPKRVPPTYQFHFKGQLLHFHYYRYDYPHYQGTYLKWGVNRLNLWRFRRELPQQHQRRHRQLIR